MTIDIKALWERLPSFDFIVYTNRTEFEPVADGDYVLAADAHELLEAAADRIAALEAENQRLREALPRLVTTAFYEGVDCEYVDQAWADSDARAEAEALAAGDGE